MTYLYVNKLLKNIFKSYSSNDFVIDYGCGDMPYKKYFPKYIGVDIQGEPDILIREDEQLPFADKSIDMIISSQVLEHVKEPEFYLNECKRLLKPNGKLLLSTHGTWQYHTNSDYYRWTRQGLEYILRDFKIKKIIPLLGQLALSTQLKLTFYDSLFKKFKIGFLFYPFALLGQIKMIIEDLLTPERVKDRDSAIYFCEVTP